VPPGIRYGEADRVAQAFSPFWFTTSELLTKPTPAGGRTVPLYLLQPEVIFKRIWASPVEDKFLNLAD
jgi:hypothetical protein